MAAALLHGPRSAGAASTGDHLRGARIRAGHCSAGARSSLLPRPGRDLAATASTSRSPTTGPRSWQTRHSSTRWKRWRGLVEQLRQHGGTLHQGRRVRTVSLTGRAEAQLDDGSTVRAEHVVLATGTPILDRGLYFAKLEPQRSYALAFVGAPAPEGMYLSAGSDSRSVRDAPDGAGGTRLLVGGAGHSVGRTRSEAAHVERLRRWTEQYFPGAVETHQWSAQDYRSHDSVPYVGPLPRGLGRIYVATGFDKWGMTNGVAAARSISGQILGEKPSWAKTLGRRLTGPTAAAHLCGDQHQGWPRGSRRRGRDGAS